MTIDFDSEDEKKKFGSAIRYGIHAISGLSLSLKRVYHLTVISNGKEEMLNSRHALEYLDHILDHIGENVK